MTLIFLSLGASVFIRVARTGFSTVIFVILACSIVMHGYLTSRNGYVRGLLRVGWTPLFAAVMISTCSGLVLERVVTRLPGFAAIAPVLTAISGNIATISVSRISSALHAAVLPPRASTNLSMHGFLQLNQHDKEPVDDDDDGVVDDSDHLEDLSMELEKMSPHHEPVRKTGVVLMLLSCTILGGFALLQMCLGEGGGAGFDVVFFVGFMLCVVWTSLVSLLAANHLTHWLWARNLDPDFYAIPLLTSSIDLLGQTSLVLTFLLFKH